MLKLVTQITFIKNIASVGVPLSKQAILRTNSPKVVVSTIPESPTLSNDFTVPTHVINATHNMTQNESISFFKNWYEAGNDVGITFNFVNNIEISSSFKDLTKSAKITFPRNLNFNGLNLMRGSNPIFGRGDRVIIKMGYEYLNPKGGSPETLSTLKEVFRGYVVKVGMGTPVELECQDQMFGLKQMKVMYPVKGDSAAKITLKNLLMRILTKQNTLLTANQLIFDFVAKPNTATVKNPTGNIPIVLPLDTSPFTYSTSTEKSVAEVLSDLKKSFIYILFSMILEICILNFHL